MAIDHRILQQIGVKSNKPALDIFNSIIQDQRNAPLREQAIEQGRARTDLLNLQTEQATSPQGQLLAQQQQAQQVAQGYAQSLKPLLNNPPALVEQLQRNRQRMVEINSTLPPEKQLDISGIDDDIIQAQTPEGLALLADEVNTALTPLSASTKSAGQREFESKLVGLDDEQQNEATLIALGLKPRATGSAAQTIAATGVTDDVAGSEAIIAGAKEAATQTAGNIGKAVGKGLDAGVKAFEKIPSVKTAITNYDDAIAQLDAGAETGIIDSMLPSFTAAGKNLDNTIKRLGLDVVGNTTFGALSESELAFALKAAIPDNLQPAELRKWLVAKRNAQQKLLAGLDEMANFLGDGTKTLVDWNNRQAVNTLAPSTSPQVSGGNVDLSKLSIEELKAMRGDQ